MASIFLRTVIIFAFLFLAMKVMGKRQVGELEVSELIATLLISEIAALPIGDPDLPLFNALIPTGILVSIEVFLSAWKQRSHAAETAIDGKAVFLIYKGRIEKENLDANRISLSELIAECRQAGIGDLSLVDYCILESNGKISVLPVKEGDGRFAHALIVEGRVQEENLEALGIDGYVLRKILGGTPPDRVYLLTIDDEGKVEKWIQKTNARSRR